LVVDREHALTAVEVGGLLLEQVAHEVVELGVLQLALHPNPNRADLNE
jgi:hypothetical protein